MYLRNCGKSIVCILLFAAGILLLSGCSSGTASENAIKEEIALFEDFDGTGLTISSYSETKRKTSSSDKSDIVWVSVIAQNETAEYSADYVLEYTKYNNGWILDHINREYSSYSAKNLVDEETIKNDALEVFEDDIAIYNLKNVEIGEPMLLESESSDMNGVPYCVFSVSCSGENDYILLNASIVLSYELDHNFVWYYCEDNVYGYGTSTSIEIKGAPDSSLPETELLNFTGSYQIQSESWTDASTYEFVYQGVDDSSYKYLNMYYTIVITCGFDARSGWFVSDYNSELTNVDINATGIWTYDDGIGENKYTFNIVSVDQEQVTYTADLTITDWLLAIGEDTYLLSTNGETRQREWQETTEADYSLITTEEVCWIEFGLANAHYYDLEFRSYTGEQYDESGFYFRDSLLVKQP